MGLFGFVKKKRQAGKPMKLYRRENIKADTEAIWLTSGTRR